MRRNRASTRHLDRLTKADMDAAAATRYEDAAVAIRYEATLPDGSKVAGATACTGCIRQMRQYLKAVKATDVTFVREVADASD